MTAITVIKYSVPVARYRPSSVLNIGMSNCWLSSPVPTPPINPIIVALSSFLGASMAAISDAVAGTILAIPAFNDDDTFFSKGPITDGVRRWLLFLLLLFGAGADVVCGATNEMIIRGEHKRAD